MANNDDLGFVEDAGEDIGFQQESDDLGFQPQQEEKGTLESMLSWLESYAGAPSRAGIVAGASGENPIKAFVDQWGAPTETAPTGVDVSASLGASRTKDIPYIYPGMSPYSFRDIPDPERTTPAETLAPFATFLADWTNAALLLGGLKGIGKLGQAGVIGNNSKRAMMAAEAAKLAEAERATQTVRSGAAGIKQAASELGVPAFEGQMYNDPMTQRLESWLLNSPTFTGRARQKQFLDAMEKIKGQVSAAVPESSLSKYEVGSSTQDALKASIANEKAPISQIYKQIAESTQNIPVSERSRAAIARNVSRLPGAKFEASPSKSLIESASRDIPKLETVDDIKRYKTMLNKLAIYPED
jgi:hypothetical protein